MEKLTRARERRDLSIAQLAKETGVNWQVLRNLEGGGGATRPSRPDSVSLMTALRLIWRLWPDLQLRDFVASTGLRVSPRDDRAERTLARNVEH